MWEDLDLHEKNLLLLKLLVSLSVSDHALESKEISYLIQLCHYFNLDPNLISTFAKEDNEIPHLPKSEQDRMSILYHLLFMAKADEVIHVEEETFIYTFAFKLGFSDAVVRDFIALVKTHKNKPIPTNDMLDVIRKYNN